MICYVCVSVFRQVYVYRSGLACMCSCLRVSFTVTVLSYFVCATESHREVGRQMEIKNFVIQRTCIIYVLVFSPTKKYCTMWNTSTNRKIRYSFKSSSSGCIKLMAHVYGFEETYYDSSGGCEEKLIYRIIYHFYATASSACYVHTIQNINVTVRFLPPYTLKHTHESIKSTISLLQYP